MFPKENPLITHTKAGRASSLMPILQDALKQEENIEATDKPSRDSKD